MKRKLTIEEVQKRLIEMGKKAKSVPQYQPPKPREQLHPRTLQVMRALGVHSL